ncbi:hypothetical protein B0A55_03411 [Friedmanniomyces simplex]|uniref:Amidase domain-containing protein n=1 Tax=Friedmanniomyces simplex TaxID=329884 RepID=A0A4U0XJI2_9PEZI|nr:hypothetical protein B0A55_03411 [Friedmanniomyces simplex]
MAHSDEPESDHQTLSLVEASIADLQLALATGALTSVELVTKYLQRIIAYDTRGPCLNSIVVFNPHVFDEASASDARRATRQSRGRLEGIPYTLKDSMMTKGLTCAAGSPAFAHLVANHDSFVASQLSRAGAVLIGKTNTPPMMASGMHRGFFAAFGLGSETVSSGRSPASNNGLVAYTPSRTVISPRGIWPLYPTCDVVVPHTRTVTDMLAILDVLTVEDPTTDGDFWRQQTFVEIPKVDRPRSYYDLLEGAADSLKGKRIAVPAMYIGGHDPKAKPTTISPAVIELWKRARADLEALGATVVETDFPLVTNYEDDAVSGHTNNVVGFPPDWNGVERGELVAYSWDDFLIANGDPKIRGLADVDGTQLFPARPEGYLPDRWLETKNFLNYPHLVDLARSRPTNTDHTPQSIFSLLPNLSLALPALERQRTRDLDTWLFAPSHRYDLVAFPSAGDIGRADLETNAQSAEEALRNGVKYSHGNRALRHLGVPSVTVTMGVLGEGVGMPVGLTFAGAHGADSALLQYAYAYEQVSKRRVAPPVTPALGSDLIDLKKLSPDYAGRKEKLELVDVVAVRVGETRLRITGKLAPQPPVAAVSSSAGTGTVTAYLKQPGPGLELSSVTVDGVQEGWALESEYEPFEPAEKPLYGGFGEGVGKVMVILRAGTERGSGGRLLMVDGEAPIVR